MKLRFGTARNGWLSLELEDRDTLLRFDLSHLPNDFLLELTEALLPILEHPGERTVRLNQEPVEVEWRFHRSGDKVNLTLVEYPDSRRTKGTGTMIFEASGAPIGIVLPMWRGLRELAGRTGDEGFGTHWRLPFPDQALDALSVRIGVSRGKT